MIATAGHVLAIAERAGERSGRRAYAMVILRVFTGMRWGKITGLARVNCHTEAGYLLIDPEAGALHEMNGTMWLGPRKATPRPPYRPARFPRSAARGDHRQP